MPSIPPTISNAISSPKIAIIYYSTWGHIASNAKHVLKGIKDAGGDADLYQIPETLPADILDRMKAAPKDDSIPEITIEKLLDYDAFLFGIPSRFGNMPAQWKVFWDKTGRYWTTGKLYGKPFGLFFCSGPGGGQESVAMNAMSTFIHHGMIFIPLGYNEAHQYLTNVDEVHGGSPWGAGSVVNNKNARAPSELENTLHELQGKLFFKAVQKF